MKSLSWIPEAHTCNPSYGRQKLGGSQFEGSLGKWFLTDPIFKKPITRKKKKGLVE
jgi:hypothetical protein